MDLSTCHHAERACRAKRHVAEELASQQKRYDESSVGARSVIEATSRATGCFRTRRRTDWQPLLLVASPWLAVAAVGAANLNDSRHFMSWLVVGCAGKLGRSSALSLRLRQSLRIRRRGRTTANCQQSFLRLTATLLIDSASL